MKPVNGYLVLILVFLLLGLSACGFQLRGTNLQALQNASIFVQSSNANVLAAEVKRQLLDADVNTVSSAPDAEYIVNLSNESFSRKILSVSPTTGKVEEYEVTYTAMLKITGPDESSTASTKPVSASRDYTFDEGSVLGTFTQESVLKKDIAKQVAATVLRRLRAVIQ
ncbi:MAG: LPS assembly lipoprotein LptE [Gammaproteobacteria bacterium]